MVTYLAVVCYPTIFSVVRQTLFPRYERCVTTLEDYHSRGILFRCYGHPPGRKTFLHRETIWLAQPSQLRACASAVVSSRLGKRG